MTITKLLYHPITIFVLTILIVSFFFSLDKSSKKMQSSSANIHILEHEVEQISNEVIELEEKINRTTSLQFKEKVVRDELLLQKEGEFIIQIPDFIGENTDNTCINDCSNTIINSPIFAWKELLL